MKISKLKNNPNNPRIIKDDKFEKLKKSISEFPEMMEKRPIVCVTDVDGKLYPLGGNMRLKALQELKYKEIPDSWVVIADEWTEEQRREFVIKDNVGFGEWDYDLLKQQYEIVELEEWGVTVPYYEPVNPDDFFNFHEENEEKEKTKKLILEYSESDFEKVSEAIEKLGNSPEQVIWKLLNLDK